MTQRDVLPLQPLPCHLHLLLPHCSANFRSRSVNLPSIGALAWTSCRSLFKPDSAIRSHEGVQSAHSEDHRLFRKAPIHIDTTKQPDENLAGFSGSRIWSQICYHVAIFQPPGLPVFTV